VENTRTNHDRLFLARILILLWFSGVTLSRDNRCQNTSGEFGTEGGGYLQLWLGARQR
jgi:hypothetical protein